ncbi:hypothetical protein A3I56_00420 [Candidatus Roizmanbacteria bacterium RIFCSPLOWO2_02_FULL_43_10]|uniref:Recombinase domain-containing protein n=3 Tax=Candidatus Roizmaniibacteriota TaxID=1752723 RepID=A0A1F7K1N1_9BACT|nr:MAG: hypothetical protein A3D08_00315 [Candidatus Roizmanbacteria bacterium RIFCSPHIGHO2_02_FULL_43_11]OGK37932.1 MAG: hypothetical protein A3F32_02095 [Candidatus Roizmanbacteria bacterium RIFCSPHIGHO2_12_FULL_42_10]OGK61778.1 MAG: hypothetical protein A3I56_00420 [Candidatus Roizmanbacteria bacterium RIFCSPLOWO2_02_FULL_43_10]
MTNKKPANQGKAWTPAHVRTLRNLVQGNTPTRVMGLKLGRTAEAIQTKASNMGVSLKPVNQSPYNRKSK